MQIQQIQYFIYKFNQIILESLIDLKFVLEIQLFLININYLFPIDYYHFFLEIF